MSIELAFSLLLIVAQRVPVPQESPDGRQPAPRGNAKQCTFRVEHRIPRCAPLSNPFFPDCSFGRSSHVCFVADTVTSWDFIGPPFGIVPFGAVPFDPFGFGLAPVVVWNEPIFVRPAPVRPGAVQPGGMQPIEPRGAVQVVPPGPARTATTDIPDRMVEDLLGRRRPSLAHRAQAARLEGAGDVMFRAGYFSRAAERYQQTLSQTPDNDEAQFKRGAALIATGHYGEALRVLRDALRDRPDWPFVAHDLLSLFPDEASVAKLLENLDREARRPDADGDPLFLRAYILYFTGQRDAAAAIFRNPPGGVAPAHYQVFQQALERARNGQ